MRRHLASIGTAAALVVTAVIVSFAQSEAPRPAAGGPALDGFCPVAYLEMKQAVKGDPRHTSEHEGHTYHLTNAEAKQLFDRAPGKYVPAYDGICATGVAMGMKLTSETRKTCSAW